MCSTDEEDVLWIWKVDAIVLNKQMWIADKRRFSNLCKDEKNRLLMKCYTLTRVETASYEYIMNFRVA
jgi:hypothetical protein